MVDVTSGVDRPSDDTYLSHSSRGTSCNSLLTVHDKCTGSYGGSSEMYGGTWSGSFDTGTDSYGSQTRL